MRHQLSLNLCAFPQARPGNIWPRIGPWGGIRYIRPPPHLKTAAFLTPHGGYRRQNPPANSRSNMGQVTAQASQLRCEQVKTFGKWYHVSGVAVLYWIMEFGSWCINGVSSYIASDPSRCARSLQGRLGLVLLPDCSAGLRRAPIRSFVLRADMAASAVASSNSQSSHRDAVSVPRRQHLGGSMRRRYRERDRPTAEHQ